MKMQNISIVFWVISGAANPSGSLSFNVTMVIAYIALQNVSLFFALALCVGTTLFSGFEEAHAYLDTSLQFLVMITWINVSYLPKVAWKLALVPAAALLRFPLLYRRRSARPGASRTRPSSSTDQARSSRSSSTSGSPPPSSRGD